MSNKIINLNSRRPHVAGAAKCIACGHEWEHTAPLPNIFSFQCPACRLFRGEFVYGLVPESNRDIFICECDNDLFHLTREGGFCKKCGVTIPYDDLCE